MRKFFLLLAMVYCSNLFSQDLKGEWIGVFNSDMGRRRTYELYMQLNQRGRAVWGYYTSFDGRSPAIDSASCACKVSSQLYKKKGAPIMIFHEGVISHTIDRSTCEFVNFLDAEYVVKEDGEYLIGKWFGITGSYLRPDGASGDFALKKISNENKEDLGRFFPRLEKMIEKYNKGDSVYKQVKRSTDSPAVTITAVIPPMERRTTIYSEITVNADSVEIAIVDDGSVDDDSISVYQDKKLILLKSRLSTTPLRISLTTIPGTETELLFVAENMGSIPPNTAYAVISFAGNEYKVHLSSTPDRNAAIVLKRR